MKTSPSGGLLLELLQSLLSPLHHVYLLFTSCRLGLTGMVPIVPVFFSHIRPVRWSVTVPSPLSVIRCESPPLPAGTVPTHSNVAQIATTAKLAFLMMFLSTKCPFQSFT